MLTTFRLPEGTWSSRHNWYTGERVHVLRTECCPDYQGSKPYALHCVEHGYWAGRTNKAKATQELRHPATWCDQCRVLAKADPDARVIITDRDMAKLVQRVGAELMNVHVHPPTTPRPLNPLKGLTFAEGHLDGGNPPTVNTTGYWMLVDAVTKHVVNLCSKALPITRR